MSSQSHFADTPHTQQFWSWYSLIGHIVAIFESCAVLVYFAVTPDGPDREVLIALASVMLTTALLSTSIVKRVSTRSWRAEFSFAWTILAGVTAALSAHLDGGIDSPLIFLLVLPIAFATLGLSVRRVAICGVTTLLEVAAIWFTDPKMSRVTTDAAMFAVTLVGLVVLVIGLAIARSRLEEDEFLLKSELTTRARTDMLTGCLNHGAFYERLDAEINRARRRREPLSLLMIDVDFFKSINDSYGHLIGDDALAKVGADLKAVTRNFDVVGRVGGDEFAVVLPSTTEDHAAALGERINAMLSSHAEPTLSVSIGTASLDPTNPTGRQLIRRADANLYEAKMTGRAKVVRQKSQRTRAASSVSDGASAVPADLHLAERRVREADRATNEALSILDAYQTTSSVGLGFVDLDFRIIRINPMLAAVHGGKLEDQLGRPLSEIVPQLWPQLEPMYRSVVETGNPVVNFEVSGESAEDPEVTHFWLANLYPVKVHDEIFGIGIVVIDISDQKWLAQSSLKLTRSVVAALANAVEMRDPYTAGHEGRVAKNASLVAHALELDAAVIESIELAANIHDIGKIALPAEILSKPGKLSQAEMELLRTHAQLGADMLERVEFPSMAVQMVRQHHERMDGSGYPDGLVGEQISIGARIIAVVDVFDAMASARPYRAALNIDVVLDELRSGAGTLYDADVVASFMQLWRSHHLTV